MQACPQEFLDLALRLAEAAREVTLPYFRSGVAVDDKPDLSPVTVADREAEARLRGLIAEAQPGHGIIGEEYGSERADAEFVWVLDPIDGTKAFITGNPLFGTLIALSQGGRPLLGVIDMPALGERWVGAGGHPTRFHDRRGVGEARVRPCPTLAQAVLRSTHPAMFGSDTRQVAFARVRDAAKLTLYGGDCFCYGQLASGFVDLVVESGLGTYDYMALVPVITGSGGLASDWSGRPLDLESDGDVLCAGDPALHAAARDLLCG